MYFRGKPYAVGRAGSLEVSIEKAYLRRRLQEQQSTQAWLRLQRTFSVLSSVCSEAVEVLWFARWGWGGTGESVHFLERPSHVCASQWNLNFVKRPVGLKHNVGEAKHLICDPDPCWRIQDWGIYDDCRIIGPISSKRMPWIWIQFWRKRWDPNAGATQILSESVGKETDGNIIW